MKNKLISVAFLLVVAMGGCKPVKEYQKMYLNDSEMELSMRRGQKFENNFNCTVRVLPAPTAEKRAGAVDVIKL